jgi:hypothetical protein
MCRRITVSRVSMSGASRGDAGVTARGGSG